MKVNSKIVKFEQNYNENEKSWFQMLDPPTVFDKQKANAMQSKKEPFFFGDMLAKTYSEEMIKWELARFKLRREVEQEPSIVFFRHTFNTYVIWLELLNAFCKNHNHNCNCEGDAQVLTTVTSIIDRHGISRNTVKRILREAHEANFITKNECLKCKINSYKATEKTMYDFLQRNIREVQIVGDLREKSVAFMQFIKFNKEMEEKDYY